MKEKFVVKVAVTYEKENIFQHFGRISQFKLYDAEGDHILSEEIMDTNGTGHGVQRILSN